MNRWAIMGFMGMADGGRIKVSVNCKSSAEFMRGKKKQCKCARTMKSFSFKSSVVQKIQLSHCFLHRAKSFLLKVHRSNSGKKKGWVISFNKQSEALAVNKNNYLFWIKSSRPSCESGVQKHKQSSQSPDNIDFHPAWGVLVELSIARAKASLHWALRDPSETSTLISHTVLSLTSFL